MGLGSQINFLIGIEAKHALYNKYGEWYHKLNAFPGVLIDLGGYILFETSESFLDNPHLSISPTTNHIHIPCGGIMTIPGYQAFSPAQLVKLATIITNSSYATNEESLRIKRTINSILRDRTLVNNIKKLYKNTCQLCGIQLEVKPKIFYSEVHHIKPLGKPHNGPDVKENILCVCPNHHALLDFFAIPIDIQRLKLNKHLLQSEYIAYHNHLFNSLRI